MLTANVGHGQAVAECGNASASAARARVPSAPPAKTAATSRRSALGSATGRGCAEAGRGPDRRHGQVGSLLRHAEYSSGTRDRS